MEQTHRFKQSAIVDHVDEQSKQKVRSRQREKKENYELFLTLLSEKVFDLLLDFGPYKFDFTRNGR